MRRSTITDTIRSRLFSGLHLGLFKHGGRLPSVRELSRELAANPRVVLAAYRALEREGLVSLRERSGVYVAPAATLVGAESAIRADWMVDVLMRGLARGIPGTAMADSLQRVLETRRLHAVVMECNADQLHSVPAELRRDYGFEVSALDVATLDGRGRPPGVLRRADLLVSTPFHRRQVERLAETLGTPKVVITMCADLFAEVRRLLPATPVYFVVADPRFAAKLHRLFEGAPGADNLRPRIVGQDDLEEIPDAAPTYLTQLARERVGDLSLPRRVLPEARVFSNESARQLLSFVVRSNGEARPEGRREVASRSREARRG